MHLWLFLIALPALAAVDNLQIVGATSTQIIISFTKPTAGAACTIEASIESDYTPLEVDLDPGYYTGADDCSRSGNIVNGRVITAVLGRQGPAAIQDVDTGALAGFAFSRALRADTQYYIRVVAGGDTATITARTTNIPFGSTAGEALAVKAAHEYSRVTENPLALSSFNDPFTGTLIKQHPEFFGYAFAISTKDMPAAVASDCAKTISGVLESCWYSAAEGSSWTASSGTLTDAIRANDSNWAEYSGTSQAILRLRLGAEKAGNNTSVENEILSYQNLVFVAKTSSTTGDGEEAEVCVSMDIDIDDTCASPWKTFSLTTSDATYRICHTAPCSVAENPGDWITYNNPGLRLKPGRSRIYNESGTLTTVKFSGDDAAADCTRLQSGESFYTYRRNTDQFFGFTVSAKSCGSSPPQVTVTQSNDITHNGTTGVGFFTHEGIGSYHYGLLVRKKSTTQASTISVNYALWRAVWSMDPNYNENSGGFGDKCQSHVKTAGGYNLCATAVGIIGMKPNATNTGMDIVYYGVPVYRGDIIGGSELSNSEYKNCLPGTASSYVMWDHTVAGRLYCNFKSTYPNPNAGGTVDERPVLVQLDLALTAPAAPDPDGYQIGANARGAPLAVGGVKILTRCFNGCALASDDYTPMGQLIRLTSGWTSPLEPFDRTRFSGCGIGIMINAGTLLGSCAAGSQNASGWVFAFDYANGTVPGVDFSGTKGGNTQQIYGAFLQSNTPLTRHCNVHTAQAPIGTNVPFYVSEVSSGGCPMRAQLTTSLSSCTANANPGTCGACPNVTMDGVNYNGKNWCGTIGITSSYPTGSPPGTYETGDPVQSGCSLSPNFYYDQKLRAGDYVSIGGELLRLLVRNSNTSWEVVRGWGSWQNGSFPAIAHSIGDNVVAECWGQASNDPTLGNPDTERGTPVWYFDLDPLGGQNTTYTFLSRFHNHGHHFNGKGTNDKYNVATFDFSDYAAHKNIFLNSTWSTISLGSKFAAANLNCNGNTCEYHPGAQHVLAPLNYPAWFHDVNPRLFHQPPTSAMVTEVSTNIYRINNLTNIQPRLAEQEVWTGSYPLLRSNTLSGNAAGRGKWCPSFVNNDCFSGSVAGEVYFSSDIYDETWNSVGGCREVQFVITQFDICFGNATGASGSLMQYLYPTNNTTTARNASLGRVVSKDGRRYREPATVNVKSSATGYALLGRNYRYYVPPPPINADSKNRGTFQGIPVPVSTIAGANNALVEFGYNTSFQCSRNRDESCYAEAVSVNETTPFRFSHETLTGVSCASGCTVVIPAIDNRTLYYRVKVRNAGGTVIYTGPTIVRAVK